MSATGLGDFLRFYRMRIPLTQGELAERTGVSVRTIGYLERGRATTPHRSTIDLLVEGLALCGEEAAEFARLARGDRDGGTDPVTDVSALCAVPPVLTPVLGRDQEYHSFEGFVRDPDAASPSRVAVIHGLPGVGKTAFAVDAAHRLAAGFDHGCLFVDMHGMGEEPLPVERAAHRLLRVLGVEERGIPAGLDGKLALYQSLLRDRAVLLVLDNVLDEAQARPLTRDSPGSVVLVTSRSTLVGLNAGYRMSLGPLDADRSVALLGDIIGLARVEAEPEMAERVAKLCGGVPLALLIAGNRIASRPQWTVGDFASRFVDERRRLSALAAGGLQVRTAFELSAKHLTPAAAVMLRRLALVPGVDSTVELAVVVSGQTEHVAEAALEELANASLLGVGEVPGRYTQHDLLRAFARERLELDEDPAAVLEAATRVRHWLLTTATKAALRFDDTAVLGLKTAWHDDIPAAAPGEPEPIRNRECADRWLAAELEHWRGALRSAVELGEHQRVLHLSQAMAWFALLRGGDGELWGEVFRAGVAAARALGDTRAEARQLDFLSWTLWELCGQLEEAAQAHAGAAEFAGEMDALGLSRHLYFGASIHWHRGEQDKAIADATGAADAYGVIGYEVGRHVAIGLLAWFLGKQGKRAESEAAHRQCVTYLRAYAENSAGDELLASVLARHVECLPEADDLPTVLELLEEAESLYCKHDITSKVTWVMQLRGAAYLAAGQLQKAADELTTAFETTRIPQSRIEILVRLAEVADETGDADVAREHRVRALAECAAYDAPAMRAVAEKLAGELTRRP
ncbi:NB-ARC domain-containing protein [Amycolatopsis sp. cg5]|uniref:NB-ARC domain-containing protein n=1 Tax=Amycolatopsis sp. cg5 TaxID=3238802 RepID=UPI0035262D8E